MKQTVQALALLFTFSLIPGLTLADTTKQKQWIKKARSLKTDAEKSAFFSKSIKTVQDKDLFRTVAKSVIQVHHYKKHAWIQGAVPALMHRIKDPNLYIRTWASVALGEMRAKQAYPALCAMANEAVRKLKATKDKKLQKKWVEDHRHLIRAVAKIRGKKPSFAVLPCVLAPDSRKSAPRKR